MVKKKKKRASVLRERNAGTMSEAEFRSFIISALRDRSRWWKPKTRCIARARIGPNKYRCESCGAEGPGTLPPLPGRKRKRKNIQADHSREIVPVTGFEGYDSWIKRCFVEADKYQAICWECHSKKTKEENIERRAIKKGEEVWRKVDEFPDKDYYVSNLGRVKNLKSGRREDKGEKILSIQDNGNGYKIVSIGHSLKRKVHRLVAKAFIGEIEGMSVCHKDDNPSNNNATNLFIGTQQDNMNDKVSKGRHIIGGKTIYQYSLKGEFIKKWEGGAGEIKRKLGYNDTGIYHCCNGKFKTAKGYIWSWNKEIFIKKHKK